MSIKSQIQYTVGINDNYLTEGIRFLKNSNRIGKLILKFQSALNYSKDPEIKRDVTEYIRELQRAKLDFESVEQKFASGDKVEAKEEYQQLRIKFSKIVADINKESIKKFMIAGGIAVVAFSVFASIIPSHNVAPEPPSYQSPSMGMPSRSSLTTVEKSIQEEIRKNNDMLKITKDKIRALDLFSKNQKLIEKLGQQQIKIENKLGQ